MVEGDMNNNTSNITSVRELGNVSLQCPKLTETNYTTWALMMETILKAYGIWETIVAKEGVTTNEKKENTSKTIIFQTLPHDILMQVAQYSTAKEVWDSIKVKNLGADLVQKAQLQTLRSELETLRIKPNEKVIDFGGKLSSIMAKFKGLGETLEDKTSQDAAFVITSENIGPKPNPVVEDGEVDLKGDAKLGQHMKTGEANNVNCITFKAFHYAVLFAIFDRWCPSA
nr:zinc finger, CCHC-type [Tanacetum cinerariifolium]